ncbi:MAG: 3-phosphoserine/phosphohydroxythreonine transaminase [Gammaproteobacteria bacterium]|nr:3-phosphoserine/phosphohydroxythreonine transaminase [Gammaproteobacteria bacterium]
MTAEAARPAATARTYHFGAGPAMLPPEVIAEIRAELPQFRGSGVSILELGHRSPEFRALMRETESDLRELMTIPSDYAVLFLQGGATLQFAMAPLNLGGRGAYLVTGQWSAKAWHEAERVAEGQAVWDGSADGYTRVPTQHEWRVPGDARYLHYTVNETIAGVEFHSVPACDAVPLVADMTSMILSRPVTVSEHALIYASAQKNLGIAGITVVILNPAALHTPPRGTPALLDYRVSLEAASLPHTPPVFAWYVLGKMLKWTRVQGGVAAMAAHNQRKAQLLHAVLDASDFYINRVDKASRSWMNVPFRLRDPQLEAAFLQDAAAAGLKNLAGHRSSGGMRASIYNAIPESGVATLAEFMRDFERRHG